MRRRAAQGHPGRRRHGRRQRRRGGRARRAVRACGGWSSAATSWPALAAELGSDVTFALHGGTALGTGRGEQIVPVLARHRAALGDRAAPRRAVHPRGVLASSTACAPTAEPDERPGRAGAGGARRRRPAPARAQPGQRPAGRGRQHGPGPAPHAARRGRRRARWPGSSPDPARPARSSAPTPTAPSRWPPSWPAPGVCRTVRVAHGPGAAAPASSSTPATNRPRVVPAAVRAGAWPPVRA